MYIIIAKLIYIQLQQTNVVLYEILDGGCGGGGGGGGCLRLKCHHNWRVTYIHNTSGNC